MIRHFLDARTGRRFRVYVREESFGVLTGDLYYRGRMYPATFIEVWPGVWERQKAQTGGEQS